MNSYLFLFSFFWIERMFATNFFCLNADAKRKESILVLVIFLSMSFIQMAAAF